MAWMVSVQSGLRLMKRIKTASARRLQHCNGCLLINQFANRRSLSSNRYISLIRLCPASSFARNEPISYQDGAIPPWVNRKNIRPLGTNCAI